LMAMAAVTAGGAAVSGVRGRGTGCGGASECAAH
jgi:hypothetical protein